MCVSVYMCAYVCVCVWSPFCFIISLECDSCHSVAWCGSLASFVNACLRTSRLLSWLLCGFWPIRRAWLLWRGQRSFVGTPGQTESSVCCGHRRRQTGPAVWVLERGRGGGRLVSPDILTPCQISNLRLDSSDLHVTLLVKMGGFRSLMLKEALAEDFSCCPIATCLLCCTDRA